VHVGRGRFDRVDEAIVHVNAYVHFHPVDEAFRAAVIPLIPLLGLVHFGIPLTFPVLVPPAHSGYALVKVELGAAIKVASMIVPCFMALTLALRWASTTSKICYSEMVLLQQVPERENRGLIRDPVTDHVDPRETAHGGHLDQGLLHGRIAERIPLLKQVDAQHGCQRIGHATNLGAGLGIVGLNQIKWRFPRHHHLHFAQKSLPPSVLFGCGLLVITKAELLDTHEPCSRLRSQDHSHAG